MAIELGRREKLHRHLLSARPSRKIAGANPLTFAAQICNEASVRWLRSVHCQAGPNGNGFETMLLDEAPASDCLRASGFFQRGRSTLALVILAIGLLAYPVAAGAGLFLMAKWMFAADQDAQRRVDHGRVTRLAVHPSADQQMWSSFIRE